VRRPRLLVRFCKKKKEKEKIRKEKSILGKRGTPFSIFFPPLTMNGSRIFFSIQSGEGIKEGGERSNVCIEKQSGGFTKKGDQ
jgi:hypothetical protein